MSRKHRVADPREQVLASALRLFTRHGYFNTSVHDIARHAGVSIGSIYHHFRDKEDIARSLYAGLLAQMVERIEAIQSRHRTTRTRCHALMKALFEITEEEPEAMEFMLYAKHREFLPSATPVCSSKPFAMMREMVREGMEHGEVRSMDPMVASTCLFGGAMRLIMARLDRVLREPLPSQLEAVWACSWRAVAA